MKDDGHDPFGRMADWTTPMTPDPDDLMTAANPFRLLAKDRPGEAATVVAFALACTQSTPSPHRVRLFWQHFRGFLSILSTRECPGPEDGFFHHYALEEHLVFSVFWPDEEGWEELKEAAIEYLNAIGYGPSPISREAPVEPQREKRADTTRQK